MYLTDRVAGAGAEDRRFALKRATDAAHRRVEGVVQAASMFASREGYHRYLAATFKMRAEFERLLDVAGAAQIWPEWPRRRIAALVAHDITDLGKIAPQTRELPENFTCRLDAGELVAILYVLEGSALGARVLVKLASEIGLSAGYGARHLFTQAGDRDAWRSFTAMMSELSEPPSHAMANRTFEAFACAYEEAAD